MSKSCIFFKDKTCYCAHVGHEGISIISLLVNLSYFRNVIPSTIPVDYSSVKFKKRSGLFKSNPIEQRANVNLKDWYCESKFLHLNLFFQAKNLKDPEFESQINIV